MKFLMTLTILLSIFLTPVYAADHDFSPTQIDNMQKAYKFGKSKPLKYSGSRIDFGYIMAAIMWKETSAGINCGTSGRVVGPYQNMVSTVKSRMKQQGINKSHSQVVRDLQNHNTAAYWSRAELEYWLKVHNGNISKALASYNAGWNSRAGTGYSNNVLRKAQYLKSNNILKVE